MKYIIDIPNEMVIKSPLKGLTLGIPMIETSTQKWFIIPTDISLIPHSEPQKWIPCSERLPSDSDYYLVTDAYGDVSVIWFAHEKDYYVKSEWRETEDEILAWMPLPEPYEKRE